MHATDPTTEVESTPLEEIDVSRPEATRSWISGSSRSSTEAPVWNWTVAGGPIGNRRIGTTTATWGFAATLRALRLVRRVLM